MVGEWPTSEHEHAHYLWNRRRLYSGRTIVAAMELPRVNAWWGESFLSTRFSSASLSLPAKLGIAGSIMRRYFAYETTSAIGPPRRSSISFPRLFIIGGIDTAMNRPSYGECYIRFTIQRVV